MKATSVKKITMLLLLHNEVMLRIYYGMTNYLTDFVYFDLL
jgi:hypothetical protein